MFILFLSGDLPTTFPSRSERNFSSLIEGSVVNIRRTTLESSP